MENELYGAAQLADLRRMITPIEAHGWKFEQPAKRYPVRATAAKVLIALANAVAPTTQREAGAA